MEVDICHLPLSLSILSVMEARNCHNSVLSVHVYPVSHFRVIIRLIPLPDIPLSSLEERKSEDIRLLQERISQLKQQMAGDSRPPGNMSKHHLGSVHVV